MRAALRSTGFSQNTALPATHCAFDQVRMSVGRRADHDRIDVAISDDRFHRTDRRATRRREALRGSSIGISNSRKARARVRRNIAAMNAADPARAQQSDPHLRPPDLTDIRA